MPGGYPIGAEVCNASAQGVDTSNSRGTAVVAGSNSYGSYTQLVASTPSDSCLMLITLSNNGAANNGNQVLAKFAVGGAGSEFDIIKDIICMNGSSAWSSTRYVFPIGIPAGSRLSAALYQTTHTDTAYISVHLFEGSYSQMESAAGADSIGISGDHGTSVTTGAANTKGSYSQLIASTSKDYIGFCIGLDALDFANIGANDLTLLDIAIGAGGSEQIIVPNHSAVIGSSPQADSIFVPIPIPAGTRISARAQDVNASKNIGVTLYGVYQ